MIMAEMPRPVGARFFYAYFWEKFKSQNYVYDTLWCMATEMRFTNKNKPTLARYYEQKEKTTKLVVSKDGYKKMLKARLGGDTV